MTEITGDLLVGGQALRGTNGVVRAVAARNGQALEPAFGGASLDDVDRACALAADAFLPFRSTSTEARAAFLEAIADCIAGIGDGLVERAAAETGLPPARLTGERARTVGQLRMFADVVRSGAWLGVRIDPALPDREPLPRPDLRLRRIALGPVAIFGASNFPLAFSVAGGDTASALAAGCPVIVKAHPAHPGTSELVGRAVQAAVAQCGMPPGTFALLHDTGLAVGAALVADPRIKAVGFTGSRRGGLALLDIARRRPEPVPVFAEMSSVNPVIVLPGALRQRASAIAGDFVASMTLGAGQFCTSPGLIVAIDGPDLQAFVDAARHAVAASAPAVMLTSGIASALGESVTRLIDRGATVVERARDETHAVGAVLMETTGAALISDAELSHEAFGAAAIVVRCRDLDELSTVVEGLEGQLTIALHFAATDMPAVRRLLPLCEDKAGRIVANGFATGVEVAHAMVHGGPFPATSDGGRSTSVGSLAIERFLRPVCYQNLPPELLPTELREA